jgi:hypothetical protein
MMAKKAGTRGGRKPSGPIKGKTISFYTKISEKTRGALESEAAASGQSISQVAERMMRIGLEKNRDREIDSPMRALAFIACELAKQCELRGIKSRQLYQWTNHPFVFEAFRLALLELLEQIRPPGDITHPYVAEGFEEKETQSLAVTAKAATAVVWHDLRHIEGADAAAWKAERLALGQQPQPDGYYADLSGSSYAWRDARRALKIKSPLDEESGS